jgi:hypothetical protein
MSFTTHPALLIRNVPTVKTKRSFMEGTPSLARIKAQRVGRRRRRVP